MKWPNLIRNHSIALLRNQKQFLMWIFYDNKINIVLISIQTRKDFGENCSAFGGGWKTRYEILMITLISSKKLGAE